jgi:hypothetical protein
LRTDDIEFFTAQEAARILGVSHSRIRQLALAGIGGFKLGSQWFFRESDMARLRNRPIGKPGPIARKTVKRNGQ